MVGHGHDAHLLSELRTSASKYRRLSTTARACDQHVQPAAQAKPQQLGDRRVDQPRPTPSPSSASACPGSMRRRARTGPRPAPAGGKIANPIRAVAQPEIGHAARPAGRPGGSPARGDAPRRETRPSPQCSKTVALDEHRLRPVDEDRAAPSGPTHSRSIGPSPRRFAERRGGGLFPRHHADDRRRRRLQRRLGNARRRCRRHIARPGLLGFALEGDDRRRIGCRRLFPCDG